MLATREAGLARRRSIGILREGVGVSGKGPSGVWDVGEELSGPRLDSLSQREPVSLPSAGAGRIGGPRKVEGLSSPVTFSLAHDPQKTHDLNTRVWGR